MNNKKIGYITGTSFPSEKAHTIQIIQMCEALAKNGHDVVLVLTQYNSKSADEIFDYYDVEEDFRIDRLDTYAPEFNANFFDGIRLIIKLFSFLFHLIWYKKHRKNFDVFYTRNRFFCYFLSSVILEAHSMPEKTRWYHKIAWNKASLIVTVSSNLKEALAEKGVESRKIISEPAGVNLDKFDIEVSKEDARKQLRLPVGSKIVLYTGSFFLHEWKGVDTLLRAVKKIDERAQIMLVGGTTKEIESIKSEYKDILGQLILKERVSHSKIPLYLKSADVLVVPNKKGYNESEYYTSPLKLIEYMSSKRPIVASSLPSLKEILDQTTSRLVKPNNSSSLAKGINSILRNEREGQMLAEKAYEKAKCQTWGRRAKEIIKKFQELYKYNC